MDHNSISAHWICIDEYRTHDYNELVNRMINHKIDLWKSDKFPFSPLKPLRLALLPLPGTQLLMCSFAKLEITSLIIIGTYPESRMFDSTS